MEKAALGKRPRAGTASGRSKKQKVSGDRDDSDKENIEQPGMVNAPGMPHSTSLPLPPAPAQPLSTPSPHPPRPKPRYAPKVSASISTSAESVVASEFSADKTGLKGALGEGLQSC